MSTWTATPLSSCPGSSPSSCTPPCQCMTRPGRSHTGIGGTRPSCPCCGTCRKRKTLSGRGRPSCRRWPRTPAGYTLHNLDQFQLEIYKRHSKTLEVTCETLTRPSGTLGDTRRHSETLPIHSGHSETLGDIEETLGNTLETLGNTRRHLETLGDN